MLLRVVKLTLTFLGSLISVNTVAVGQELSADEEAAVKQAIYISELESRGLVARLYRLLHSDSREIVPRDAVIDWYENDFFPLHPQPISQITDVNTKRWTWDVTGRTYRNTVEIGYVQPFGAGGDASFVEDKVRLVEEDGEWRWFFGRSEEFVDEQIARYASDVETDDNDTIENSDEDTGLPGSKRSCTIVELYPGYPGYRGNVTGVMPHWGGLGDFSCLEELNEANPDFDRSKEDRANRRAARTLGIDGGFSDWTWENWMMIEIQRGFTPQCYSCLMADTAGQPLRIDLDPDPSDPRIRVGLLDRDGAVLALMDEVTGSPRTLNSLPEDYLLRASAYLDGGWNMNAHQLLDAMRNRVESDTSPGRSYYAIGDVYNIIVTQGEYVPVGELKQSLRPTTRCRLYIAGSRENPFPRDLCADASGFQQRGSGLAGFRLRSNVRILAQKGIELGHSTTK
jgi:hypothetical protein